MSQLPPDKSVQDTPAAMPGHPEIIETAQVSSSALSDSLSDSYPYHLLDPLQLSGSKSQKIQKKASMIDQRYLRIAENSSPDTQASTPLFNLSSKIATSTSEHLHKYPHPPSSRPSLDARRLSSAAGSSIGRTRLKSQALALRRWDMLRVKILQGRFRLPKTKQKAAAMPQDDFVAVVSTLWELLLRSRTLSGHASTSTGVDNASELIKSTDPLNMSSYQAALSATLVTPKSPASSAPGTSRDMGGAASESHTPRSAHSKPKRAGLGATPPDTSHKYAGSTLFVNGGVVGTEKSAWKLPTIGLLSCSVAPASTSYLGKCVGLEGLSLDSISKSNIGHALAIIANGLGSLQHGKLDVMGLFFAIKVHITVDGNSSFRPSTQSHFLAVSDERKENQLRAIYLLGKIGSELQKVQEYHTLLQMTGTMDKSVMDKKVYLFHAIGKYTRIFQKHSNSTEDLVLYMIYQELSLVTRILASRNKSVLDQTDPEVHIVLSVLGILNNDMEITAMNKKYVGALFKKSVNSLMQSSYPVLQKMAVQFICSWLPIVNEDAILQGIECIQSGLLYSKSLNVPNFDADEYSSEVLALEKWKYSEKCCVSMRSKLLRELIRPPGTVSKFLPVPGCPGFFYAVTTIPPLFIDKELAESLQQPHSSYEFLERVGGIPSLTFGYTYFPNPLVDSLDPLQQISRREALSAKNLKISDDSTTIPILKNPKLWENFDEIPRENIHTDSALFVRFLDLILSVLIETLTLSLPIYGKQMTEMHGFTGIVDSNLNVLESRNSAASSRDEKHMGYKQSSKVSGQDLHNLSVAKMSRASVLNSPQIDPGYTYAQHPILWPSRNPTLKSPQYSTDFLLNSPVLFDIIQPHSPDLQRILTRVVGLDKDISRITVQQSSSRMGVLSNGTRFSIYIRERSDLSRWIAVQLMVIDDNYQDNFDFYGSTSSMKSSWSSIHHISSSIKSNTTAATGNTATNEAAIVRGATTSTKTSENAFPFPIPAGFTSLNVPYFAPPVNIPPFPVGYDDKCRPYYGRQPHVKPIPLGVSNFGTRFYSGDGTLVEGGQRNILAGIDVVESYYSDDSDDWEELLPKLHRPTFVVSPIQRQRIEALFLEKLTSSLHGTQPLLKHAMTQARRWSTDSVQTISKNAIVQRNSKKGIAEMDMQDPVDIPEFLRSGLEFSYLKPNSMRVIIEPAQMEFQSVHTTITKTLTLRYRAMRGDHGECDVFLAIDPVDVFSLDSFHLKLQERQKESTFIVENLASASVLLNLFIKSEAIQMVKNSYVDLEGNSRPQSKDSIKKSVFSLPVTSIRLQPLETKTIVVYFNPSSLGLIKDTIEVRGPGGDVSFVDVVGMAGIPIAIFPESETNSLIGADVLSRERAKFISKYKQQEYNVDGPGIFNTEEELQVINSIKAAQSNGESRRNAHTLDFGICSLNTKVLVRCLTFMNLGDTPATISLFSHHPNVACPYLVRIAPHKANTIEVTLTVGEGASGVRGNLHSVIEIACPEFQNIPVHVKSFIGQALYFPVWENVFFKPCRIGQMQQLSISLINESQYDLSSFK
ncbi:hypothetical protein BASA83_007577 [Batrachochytrium salamandrivorans]|nr:hypothetical protein BASA83_007577 [Batrachochytrium salamandrivorans]